MQPIPVPQVTVHDFAPLRVVNSVLQRNSFCLLKGKVQDRRTQPGMFFSLTRIKKMVFQCKMANVALVNSLSICKLQKYKGREESGTGAWSNELNGNWLHPRFHEFRRPHAFHVPAGPQAPALCEVSQLAWERFPPVALHFPV